MVRVIFWIKRAAGYAKKYPIFFISAVVMTLFVILISYFGPRVIEIFPRSEKKLPQSTLAGIVCKNFDRRPIAVMLANDPVARPLSGIGDAEIVFEMQVSPDGITRIMALYQCNEPAEIGSIRSARGAFVDLALGMDAVFAHWGGERDVLSELNSGILDNIDALIYEGSVFFRKKGMRPPHNGFTSYGSLHGEAIKLGYGFETGFEGYPHLKEKKQTGDEKKVIRVYKAPYSIEWFYDQTDNSYDRFRAGEMEIDKIDGQQIGADVVIVMKTRGVASDIEYYEVNVTGSGDAAVYQNGEEIKGTWVKETRFSPLKFYDASGEEIPFKPGKIWIEIVT